MADVIIMVGKVFMQEELIMNREEIYVTINHLKMFKGETYLHTGDELLIRKDRDNPYDDEALAVYDEKRELRIGYVANSVATVARGTYSAGRLYDRMEDECCCRICFMIEDTLIAAVNAR